MDAYSPLAPAYGTLTADFDYDRWLAIIEDLARDAGLQGNRLLDVACGTGSSFLPLADRYLVTACDFSQRMLDEASRRAAGSGARLVQADMRELPVFGEFDLILCLDDALNHLLTPAEVGAALSGIRANLARDGIAVFDVNTLAGMRAGLSSDIVAEDERHLVLWRGLCAGNFAAGDEGSVQIDVLFKEGDLYARSTTTLTERHHPVEELTAVLSASGLELDRCLGQSPGVLIEPEADELRHSKALFVVRRSS